MVVLRANNPGLYQKGFKVETPSKGRKGQTMAKKKGGCKKGK